MGSGTTAGKGAKALTPKKRCCDSRPRCRRCPVVLAKLAKERAGRKRGKKGR